MALMSCPECSTKVSDKAASCPSCGYPIAKTSQPLNAELTSPQTGYSSAPTVTVSKNRGTFIILGLLFGALGFHNFYSGHNVAGAIKIVVLLVTFVLDASTRFYSAFSLVALVIFALWALIEIISVKTDARGNAMS
jgi:TM2 domain-containing membrane protein YozV